MSTASFRSLLGSSLAVICAGVVALALGQAAEANPALVFACGPDGNREACFGTQTYGKFTPYDMDFSADGEWLFVSDFANDQILQFRVDGSGMRYFAGERGHLLPPGQGTKALRTRLRGPSALAASKDGKWLYEADTNSHQVLRFSTDGNVVETFFGGEVPYQFGWDHVWQVQDASTEPPDQPRGLALDSDDELLHVADRRRNCYYSVSTSDRWVVGWRGGANYRPEPDPAVKARLTFWHLGWFQTPSAIATCKSVRDLDPRAETPKIRGVYVADTDKNRVLFFRDLDATGYKVSLPLRKELRDRLPPRHELEEMMSPLPEYSLNHPRGVAAIAREDWQESTGYISDSENNRVISFKKDRDGQDIEARIVVGLHPPYVHDRKLNTPPPVEEILVSDPKQPYLKCPRGLAIAPDRSLMIADTDNGRLVFVAACDGYGAKLEELVNTGAAAARARDTKRLLLVIFDLQLLMTSNKGENGEYEETSADQKRRAKHIAHVFKGVRGQKDLGKLLVRQVDGDRQQPIRRFRARAAMKQLQQQVLAERSAKERSELQQHVLPERAAEHPVPISPNAFAPAPDTLSSFGEANFGDDAEGDDLLLKPMDISEENEELMQGPNCEEDNWDDLDEDEADLADHSPRPAKALKQRQS